MTTNTPQKVTESTASTSSPRLYEDSDSFVRLYQLLESAQGFLRAQRPQDAILQFRQALTILSSPPPLFKDPLVQRASLRSRLEILEDMGDVLTDISHYEEASLTFEQAVVACRQLVEPDMDWTVRTARLYRKLASVYKRQGHYNMLRDLCTQGLEMLKHMPQCSEYIHFQLLLAHGQCHDGDFNGAFQRFRGLLMQAKHLKSGALQAEILDAMGAAYLYRGLRRRAAEFMRRSLPLHQQFGNRRRAADLINNLGIIHAQEYQYEEAKHYFLEAIKLYGRVGYVIGLANCCNNLGILCYNRGNYMPALRHYQAALSRHQKVGNVRGVIQCRINLAETRLALKKTATALDDLRAAETAMTVSAFTLYRPHIRRLFGEVWYQSGDYARGYTDAQNACILSGDMNDPIGQAQCFSLMGDIARKQRRFELCLQHYRTALSILRPLDAHLQLAQVMLGYGQLLVEQRIDVGRGEHFLEEAAELYRKIGHRSGQQEVELTQQRHAMLYLPLFSHTA